MKVAVSATGPTLDSAVDPRFGRCQYFVLVETGDMSHEAVENVGGSLGGGAGVQSGRLVAEKGAKVVLTGGCGPNADQTLRAAGIDVIVGCSGTVSEVVARFESGALRAGTASDVAGSSGRGDGG